MSSLFVNVIIMNKAEVINSYYKEAVKGLNETILIEGELWYSHILYLPKHLQIVYTVEIFFQQVNSGGLHQYFFNRYGQFAYLTIDNFKLIKAFELAQILERALDKVNEEQYSIDEFRKRAYSRKLDRIVNFDRELADFLDELDDEIDSLDEDLETLYLDYLKSINMLQ